jgi:hypothetical protein
MSDLSRLLVIMGSGETSPTMVTTHRRLLGRLGPPPVPAVLLDTPFGFQENAGELTARAVGYFADSVGQQIEVASYRSAAVEGLALEQALNRVRDARYVFAGPGSPTYALRQWATSPLPSLLRDKLRDGGCVTFASAAAVTLGVVTVPVYEIYKVGQDPEWLPGLDLLAEAGLKAAVIPHYDNAEGGTHDTRFCYLGETRLAALESSLPGDAFVLGVDEHTGLILDLEASTAEVVGRGGVTVRRDGESVVFPAGTTVAIDELRDRRGEGVPTAIASRSPVVVAEPDRPSLEAAVKVQEAAFAAALDIGDAASAAAAILAVEGAIHDWAADTLQSDEANVARARLRSMIVRLGDVAVRGAQDPAEVVGPFVDALLRSREAARSGKRFDEADEIRDLLVALGVEVNDAPSGTTWHLHSDRSAPT